MRTCFVESFFREDNDKLFFLKLLYRLFKVISAGNAYPKHYVVSSENNH